MPISKRLEKEEMKRKLRKYKGAYKAPSVSIPDPDLTKLPKASTRTAKSIESVESPDKAETMKYETPKPRRLKSGAIFVPDTTGKVREANSVDKRAMQKESDEATSKIMLEGERIKNEKELRKQLKNLRLR